MFIRRNIPVFSFLLTFALGSSAMASGVCNADGFRETVLRPAVTEYGEFTGPVYFSNMSNEIVTIPATFDTMTRKAYESLPASITYEEPTCDKEIIGSRPANISPGRISDFDVIRQADGSEYMRPLEPSAHAANNTLKEYYIEREGKTGTVSKTMLRPTPEILPNGQLRVLMKPAIAVSRASCKYEIVKMMTRRYIKTRTPAVIQRVPCISPK